MESIGAETAIVQALEDYRKGMVTANNEQLAALCLDELTYGHVTDLLQTKAEFLVDVASGRIKWKSLSFENATHRIVDDSAVSRFIYIAENESGGEAHSSRFWVIVFWHKQDGQWKMLARQAFKN